MPEPFPQGNLSSASGSKPRPFRTPDAAEALDERAELFLELGRFEEALNDAEHSRRTESEVHVDEREP